MPELAPTEQSYLCGQANQPLLYETIGRCLDRIAATHRPACPRGSSPKHSLELRRVSTTGRVVSDGACGHWYRPRGPVGIWSPNRVEWCLTQFATAKIGAIMVCINPAYRPYELEYALNKVECKAVISAECFKTSEYLEMLQALAPELAECAPGELTSARFLIEKHRTHGYRKDQGHVQF